MHGADAWERLGYTAEILGAGNAPALRAGVEVFLEELGRWSAAGHLTGYRSKSEQIEHLIIESLLLLKILPVPAGPLLDLGSGIGVPGLILKLAQPQLEVTLLEAARRRVNFLRHLIRRLHISGIAVHHGRAEVLARLPGLAGVFRTVTMRAVVGVDEAVGLARPFLRVDGHLIMALARARPVVQGRVAEVEVPGSHGRLPLRRRFLIIAASDIGPTVPRGTSGARHAHLGRREPEGRGG